jgi:tetratricopeptide (TPR) repeat protein
VSTNALSSDTLLTEFTSAVALTGVIPATASLLDRLQSQNTSYPLLAADLWVAVISSLVRSGFAPVAIDVADVAMQHFPHVVELLYWRANALRISGRQVEAEQGFRALLRHRPEHRDAALSLAFMLREAGRIEAAVQVIVDLAGAQMGDARQTLALLGFLRECGAYTQAMHIAHSARTRWPEDASVAAITGEIALALGKFDAAHSALSEALTRNPGQAPAWLRLAHCQRYADRNNPDLLRFESARANPALSMQARICAGFALGKAWDDLGDYANAAQVLRDANAQARANTPWRAQDWHRFVADQIAGRPLPALTDDVDFTPVFIVGLPRTGTTLTAATLGRHRQLRDRGELNWIAAMHASLQSQGLLHDPASLQAVRALVAAQLRRDDAPAHGYIDKNPLNFRHLDLVAAIFPNAKIIHCRRHRRDTALSLWMQHFAHDDAAFAYDFAGIAEMAAGHDELMAHWRRTLAVPIFDLDYEALASADPEVLHRLVAFLGLAPEALLQTPASAAGPITTGPITTASVWQVRQPLHTRSIGRWQHYAAFVPELAQLFADA